MNKYLSVLIAVLSLAGCSAVRKYIQDSRTKATSCTIEQLGLTMRVPAGFDIVLEKTKQSADLSTGLIWMIEKKGMEQNHLTKIELLYDRNDEVQFNMEIYIKDTVTPDLIGNGQNMKLIRDNVLVSGKPAQSIDVVNQYIGTEGEYQLHIREVIFKKAHHIFRWRFTVNEFDINQLDPVFRRFLKAISLNP